MICICSHDWQRHNPTGCDECVECKGFASGETVDITPESLKTPEGIARVSKAMEEFSDETANVANLAHGLVRAYDHGEDLKEEMQDLRAAIAVRETKQDALLRAVAGRL